LAALRIQQDVILHSVALGELHSVIGVIKRVAPAEIYNLSGQSSVALSFAEPHATLESIVPATLNVLEAMRLVGPDIRFYHAGSSESFGDTGGQPANESTAFRPRSPYGVAKAAATSLISNYREAYGLYACSGLLFNHESPLRPQRFVTRKITAAAVRIAGGSRERLALGNVEVRRDWGWAPEYVEAMWAMLQRDVPEDFVIASGVSHALEEFVAAAFAAVQLDWRGHVDTDVSLRRPSDIACSVGDPTRAGHLLAWRPHVGFAEIVARMVRAEREGAAAVS
jgi:GDPmannose 4,6-dehydratase